MHPLPLNQLIHCIFKLLCAHRLQTSPWFVFPKKLLMQNTLHTLLTKLFLFSTRWALTNSKETFYFKFAFSTNIVNKAFTILYQMGLNKQQRKILIHTCIVLLSKLLFDSLIFILLLIQNDEEFPITLKLCMTLALNNVSAQQTIPCKQLKSK